MPRLERLFLKGKRAKRENSSVIGGLPEVRAHSPPKEKKRDKEPEKDDTKGGTECELRAHTARSRIKK
jgi:hypothetical protein